MNKHRMLLLIVIALLFALTSTTNATYITNPGVLEYETLTIHEGEILWIQGGESLKIISSDLIIESGGKFINEGESIDIFHSQFIVESNGTFINRGESVRADMSLFTFESDASVINEGSLFFEHMSIYNNGSVVNSGVFGVSDLATLHNNGYVYSTGTLSFTGSLRNYGLVETCGSLHVLPLYHFKNIGVINNTGYINIDDEVTNIGIINNYGIIENSLGGGYFNNSGTINNHDTLENWGNFDNYDTINNYGVLGNSATFNNFGIINNCLSGILVGKISGNPVNTVICPGEEPVILTTCYLTEEDTNEHYNGNINVSVKTDIDTIEIEVLEPVGGNIKTILLNIDPDCIIGIESDNSNVEWKWDEDKGQGNAGFGAMVTKIDRAPGNNQQTVQYVKVLLNCEVNGVLPKNDNGYSVILHTTRLSGSPESIWLACHDGSGNNNGGTNQEIPEFPTIALPIAAIIGLAFFFQRRKE